MQHELDISIYDLSEILFNLSGNCNPFSIKLKDEENIIDLFLPYKIVVDNENVLILRTGSFDSLIEIKLAHIEYIEFQSFYKYKGLDSKIFNVV